MNKGDKVKLSQAYFDKITSGSAKIVMTGWRSTIVEVTNSHYKVAPNIFSDEYQWYDHEDLEKDN